MMQYLHAHMDDDEITSLIFFGGVVIIIAIGAVISFFVSKSDR